MRKVAEVPVNNANYRLGATENYIVAPRFNRGIKFTSPFRLCDDLEYYYNKPFYVDIIAIDSGRVTTFTQNASRRGVHIINSFERVSAKSETEVILDVPVINEGADIYVGDYCLFDILKLDYLRSPNNTLYKMLQKEITLRRFVINMASGIMTTEDFPGIPRGTVIDFPTIYPDSFGKNYCYTYL